MEPTRPAKLWGASTTTAASPAVPAVSTNTTLSLLLPLEQSVPVCSLDTHVKLTLPPERPRYLEFKAVPSSSGVRWHTVIWGLPSCTAAVWLQGVSVTPPAHSDTQNYHFSAADHPSFKEK